MASEPEHNRENIKRRRESTDSETFPRTRVIWALVATLLIAVGAALSLVLPAKPRADPEKDLEEGSRGANEPSPRDQ